MIDYQKLLLVYLDIVGFAEGVDFLRGTGHKLLSVDEWAALKQASEDSWDFCRNLETQE